MAHQPGVGEAGAPTADDRERPSIAERAARRDELQQAGRDRFTALLRSLQAGRELPLRRRGGLGSLDWHPVLWTLLRAAVVVLVLYVVLRLGTEWWREGRVDTWSGPDASVRSGVRLASCPIVDAIRVDDFPSWVVFGGSLYRYTGGKRPFLGDTPGYTMTGWSSGSLHLVLIDSSEEGRARDTILLWLQGAVAGIEYARTPECSPP